MNKLKMQAKKEIQNHAMRSEQKNFQKDSQEKQKKTLKFQFAQFQIINLKPKDRLAQKLQSSKYSNSKTPRTDKQENKQIKEPLTKLPLNKIEFVGPIKHINKKIVIKNREGNKQLVIRPTSNNTSRSPQKSTQKKEKQKKLIYKNIYKNMVPIFQKIDKNQKFPLKMKITTIQQSNSRQVHAHQKVVQKDQLVAAESPIQKQDILIQQDIRIYNDSNNILVLKQDDQIVQSIYPGQQTKKDNYIYGESLVSIQYDQLLGQNPFQQKNNLTGNQLEQKRWIPQVMIGIGFNTEVYKVLDKKTGKIVAGKKIYRQFQESQMQQDFPAADDLAQREIDILRLLKHPNIIQYIDHQINKTQTWIYMEYIGQTLQNRVLKSQSLSIDTIKHYIRQLLSALFYIHQNKIIHKDIKCANILIDSNETLKLCDFSSAKKFNETVSFKGPQTYKGTILWIAPQVLYTDKFTRKSDIWSFACTIIQLITKLPPWHEKHFENEIIAALFIGQSTEIPKIPEGIDSDLKDLLQKCFIRDPKERWSAQQLLNHPFLNATKN